MGKYNKVKWSLTDEKKLISLYETHTIKELMDAFDGRKTEEAINSKINRLKKLGKIKNNKKAEVIERALKQRNR